MMYIVPVLDLSRRRMGEGQNTCNTNVLQNSLRFCLTCAIHLLYTVVMAMRITKSEQIGVRVTPKERRQFERAAEKESTCASEWLRRLAHVELKKERAA